MAYCKERIVVNGDHREKTAVTLKCRAWTCPDCADDRKKGLIAQAIGGYPNIFLTLTLRRQVGMTPEQAAKMMARGWRLLRLRILRHRGWKKLPFIVVFEPHQSGWPHMHLLLRSAFIDWKWLKREWEDVTGSTHVDIRLAKNKNQSAAYCCKYVGKGSEKFGGCKRYWMSQDYDLRVKPDHLRKDRPKCTWTMLTQRLFFWARDWEHRGWSIERPSAWKAIARAPP